MPLSRRTLLCSLAATARATLAAPRLSAHDAPRLTVCGDDTVIDPRLADLPSLPSEPGS